MRLQKFYVNIRSQKRYYIWLYQLRFSFL